MTTLPLPSPSLSRSRAAPYLLPLLAIAAFTSFQETALPLVMAMAGALIARLLVDSPRGRPMPKTIINTAAVCSTIYLWMELQDANRSFVAALGHFITALLLCKFFERKNPRDLYQTVFLSLLLIVASAMYTSSLMFAVAMSAYLAMLIYCMILFHAHGSAAAAEKAHDAMKLPPAQEQVLTRDIRKAAVRCAVVLLPVAIVIFLFLPRTRGNSMFSQWTASAGGTFETGFSDTIQFHDYGQLAQSDVIVMEVTLTQRGINAGSEWFEPYFRGQVLDSYKKGKWEAGIAADPIRGMEIDFAKGTGVVMPEEIYNANLLTQEYTLHHTVGGILFDLAPPVYITSDTMRRAWLNKRTITFSATGREVPTLRYTVASLPVFNFAVINAPPETTPSSMEIPREISTLARGIVGDLLPPANQRPNAEQARQMAGRLSAYLRTNYPYSLEFRQHDTALDPTVDFILNRKDTGGHCEYFASAMVMLCRSVGLNARIVNGYRGGEFNSIGGYYIVRQKHSHAWAEVYLPGEGWLQSDPTPSSLHVEAAESIFKHWGSQLGQFVENIWQVAFVTFDNESRHSVVAWLRNIFQGPSDAVSDFFNAVIFSWVSPAIDNWARFTLYGPFAGLLVIAGWLIRLWRRERRKRLRIGTAHKRIKLATDTLFLEELFRLIANDAPGNKTARLAHQTPREFVEASVSSLGHAVPDARWLVDTFYAIQFGAARPTIELRTQITTALRRVKEVLVSATGPSAIAVK